MYQDISFFTNKKTIFYIILVLIGVHSASLISCTASPIMRSNFALGAPLTIKIFKGGNAKVLNLAFKEAVRIEKMMSTSTKDYTNTELLAINAKSQHRASMSLQSGIKKQISKTYTISPEIGSVISESIEISQETKGAFDITIHPLVALWGFGEIEQRVPHKKDIIIALKKINWKTLKLLSPTTLSLGLGQSIDVGGIAKGYAADAAASLLKKFGVTHAIIDFGGNIRTIGEEKPDGTPWHIGIQAPFEKERSAMATVRVGETSVVSSGVYERFFQQDGKNYFHILDSKTGYPANNGLLSVTIITKNGMRADGFSTGVFVLGLERGMALVERIKNMEAVFIDEKNKVYITSGLSETFELLSDNYQMGLALYK